MSGCAGEGTPLPGLAERIDEITGVGVCNARVIIAELGTDPSQFPAPGHAAAWARLTARTLQSGQSARPGRTGKGNPYPTTAPALTPARPPDPPAQRNHPITRHAPRCHAT